MIENPIVLMFNTLCVTFVVCWFMWLKMRKKGGAE